LGRNDQRSRLVKLSIVLPAYEEAANLAKLLPRLHSAVSELTDDYEIVVVDTHQPRDDTPTICERHRARYVAREPGDSYGDAVRSGAAAAQGEWVVFMDADGSHQPEQLQRLLDALPDADLVIGSRWVPGGSVVNWPRRREALSRGGNLYVRLLLGLGVRDATSGYRLFRRTTLDKVDLDSVRSAGYVFQTDLAWRTGQAGLRVREVPIDFVERVRGDSKMDRRVATESLRRITTWGVRERLAQLRRGGRRGSAGSA
jgi:dolichol-phosphate mannosyltransferase